MKSMIPLNLEDLKYKHKLDILKLIGTPFFLAKYVNPYYIFIFIIMSE